MSFELDGRLAGSIRSVGRVDVRTDPIFGSGLGRPMSARYDARASRRMEASLPFIAGGRLDRAVWAPQPPDAIVVSDPDSRAALPREVRRGTPIICALVAAERLWTSMPVAAMAMTAKGMAIELGRAGSDPGQSQAEHDAVFVASLTLLMLEEAPPDELVWLGQGGE